MSDLICTATVYKQPNPVIVAWPAQVRALGRFTEREKKRERSAGAWSLLLFLQGNMYRIDAGSTHAHL